MIDYKVYIAGPMRGIPEFNFPAFHKTAATLRGKGMTVFNPAERDEEIHGKDFSKECPTGHINEAEKFGFKLRDALGDDLAWICKQADAIYLLKGWQKSKGALAEKAVAEALGLDIYYQIESADVCIPR